MLNYSALRTVLVCGVVAWATGYATTAGATTYYFTQDGSGGSLGGNLSPPGYGTAQVTTVGSDLKFDIDMNPNWFIDSGNATNHNPVTFGLGADGYIISSTPVVFTALTGPFTQSTGTSFTSPSFNTAVNYALKCPANGANGCDSGGSHISHLIFYVLGAGADSLVLHDGIYIAADIYGSATGQTGDVGATLCTNCANPPGDTPIPGALPLFASGMGVLGFLGWRRKRKLAIQTA